MRFCLLAILVLASCDLRPPPPKADPGHGAPAAPAAPAVVADAAPGGSAAAPVAPALPTDGNDVSAECLAVGEHIADVWIASTKDVAEKAALTQDRAKLVRRSAVACNDLKWSDAARGCYTNAKTIEEFQPCMNMK